MDISKNVLVLRLADEGGGPNWPQRTVSETVRLQGSHTYLTPVLKVKGRRPLRLSVNVLSDRSNRSYEMEVQPLTSIVLSQLFPQRKR
jgi:hypothetical protein